VRPLVAAFVVLPMMHNYVTMITAGETRKAIDA
jgi:hypothetical protein